MTSLLLKHASDHPHGVFYTFSGYILITERPRGEQQLKTTYNMMDIQIGQINASNVQQEHVGGGRRQRQPTFREPNY
jgi:hypothetical protein